MYFILYDGTCYNADQIIKIYFDIVEVPEDFNIPEWYADLDDGYEDWSDVFILFSNGEVITLLRHLTIEDADEEIQSLAKLIAQPTNHTHCLQDDNIINLDMYCDFFYEKIRKRLDKDDLISDKEWEEFQEWRERRNKIKPVK